MLSKPSLIKGVAVPSSLSSEEMSHEHILLEAADSGRGSWTSCSSSSHDNFQSLPNPKSWDFLNTYRHTHLDDPIAEVEPTDSEPCACPKGGCSRTCGQCKGSLETSQLRQSWASSSSLSDTYEPNYGTVKRRVLESAPAEAPDGLEPRDTTDPVYKTVTSSTDRGLIGKYKFIISLTLRLFLPQFIAPKFMASWELCFPSVIHVLVFIYKMRREMTMSSRKDT